MFALQEHMCSEMNPIVTYLSQDEREGGKID